MNLNETLNQFLLDTKSDMTVDSLVKALEQSKQEFSKDEVIEALFNNRRLHVHATPNNIAQFIVDMVKDKPHKSAIDICSGTGNILYYLQNYIDDLTGVEINRSVAQLTSFTIPEVEVVNANSFTHTFTQKYDLIVGCIPFGMRFTIDGKVVFSEEAFLRKALELCSESGDVIMIVPDSLLSVTRFKKFRQEVVGKLDSVISLPRGAIQFTYAPVSILKLSNKHTNTVNFGKVEDISDLKLGYQKSIFKTVSKGEIEERWDSKYYAIKEKPIYSALDSIVTKKLADLANVIKGCHIQKEHLSTTKGGYLYLTPKHIQHSKLVVENTNKYLPFGNVPEKFKKCILRPGDIVISTIFNELKLYIYKKTDLPVIASNNMAIIRSSLDDYILSYLKTDEGLKIFSEQAKDSTMGTMIPHLPLKSLLNINIPILPFEDLNQLGDESIESSDTEQLEDLEKQLRLVKNKLELKSAELSEVKNKLEEKSAELESRDSFEQFMDNRISKVLEQQEITNKKLDSIIDVLNQLTTEFNQIKNLPKDEEEKLFKLCKSIDDKLESTVANDNRIINNYVDEIKQWLFDWELLNDKSKTFLPVAEYIFEELSKVSDTDYSPFIVQYCRTLENEILKKLFEAYHLSGLIDVDRKELTKNDLTNPKTLTFAKLVLKDKALYTLGTMNFIMSLLKENGNTLKNSKLLQHFKEFANQYFQDDIFQKEFLKDMNEITEKYRNKAAHPNIMDEELAVNCRELLRKNLIVFLESIKS